MSLSKDFLLFLEQQGYSDIREIPGRGLCGLHKFMFTTGLVHGLNELGYEGRWCYETKQEAVLALKYWDGDGDPLGQWIKYKGQVEYSNPCLNLYK